VKLIPRFYWTPESTTQRRVCSYLLLLLRLLFLFLLPFLFLLLLCLLRLLLFRSFLFLLLLRLLLLRLLLFLLLLLHLLVLLRCLHLLVLLFLLLLLLLCLLLLHLVLLLLVLVLLVLVHLIHQHLLLCRSSWWLWAGWTFSETHRVTFLNQRSRGRRDVSAEVELFYDGAAQKISWKKLTTRVGRNRRTSQNLPEPTMTFQNLPELETQSWTGRKILKFVKSVINWIFLLQITVWGLRGTGRRFKKLYVDFLFSTRIWSSFCLFVCLFLD